MLLLHYYGSFLLGEKGIVIVDRLDKSLEGILG